MEKHSFKNENKGVVLVVGAGGFIGGFLVAALRSHGWQVLRGVRAPRSVGDLRACNLMHLRTPEHWMPLLHGVDAVVNAAGILHEKSGQTFQIVHHDAPLALAQACIQCAVRRFVQVSALGHPGDGAFIASKHAFDAALLELPLSSVILRPSVVYSTSGSYGGTSLLRALAALPGAHWLPGHARWPVQPLAAEDLGQLVAAAADSTVNGIFDVGGDEALPLRDYQQAWRTWLRIPGRRAIAVPDILVNAMVILGQRLGRGPVSAVMWRMLKRGNVTAPDAASRLQTAFGMRMRSLHEALEARPSQVQDRWHAQLYFVAPALKLSIVLVFAVSALLGCLTPATHIQAMATGSSLLETLQPVTLARAGGVLDGVLAAWLASGYKSRWAVAAMFALIAGYTLALGAGAPKLWLDPLGGLLKNMALLPSLAILWILVDRR